ncbi:hypothetical protein DVH24_034140 [Malus domestica]|uniref:ESCRT-II complex subunit VPS25 n=1 Tax=Malus domestica TaxID=3750 RepID=A0A498ICQ7_MALDO|nr:hypothetical protein DVH24_034140 [Malus domestica]
MKRVRVAGFGSVCFRICGFRSNSKYSPLTGDFELNSNKFCKLKFVDLGVLQVKIKSDLIISFTSKPDPIISSTSKPPTLTVLHRSQAFALRSPPREYQMQKLGDFKLPQFFNYPPYFTLQPDWANIVLDFVKDNGLEDNVMTVEEIRSGIESRGTELHGIDRTVLMRALKLLKQKGKLAIFKGTTGDDEGLKFSI